LTVCRNIFILPGEPEIVKKKFNDIRDTFVSGTRVSSRYVFLSCEEISVAEALDKLAELFPHLTIGSYPCSFRLHLGLLHLLNWTHWLKTLVTQKPSFILNASMLSFSRKAVLSF